jgi:aminoglycoside phosphotransferase (APT) family kinase protein
MTSLGYSASKWISDKIHRTRISRHQAGSLPQVSLEECKDLLRRLPDFHLPEYDDSPAVLVHGDLQCSNIIVKGHQVRG